MGRMDAQAQRAASSGLGSVANAKRHYVRHRPEDTVLYQVVEQHVETFFDAVAEQGASLPRFVREEFDAYLRCAGSNTVSSVLSATGAGTSISSRSVASAGGCALRAGCVEWPRAQPTFSTTCCPGFRRASGW